MLQFFKTPLGIGLAIVASLGILAVVGYNFWGWFGGSAKWKSEHPDTGRTSGGASAGRYGGDNISERTIDGTIVRDKLSNNTVRQSTSVQINKSSKNTLTDLLESKKEIITNNLQKAIDLGKSEKISQRMMNQVEFIPSRKLINPQNPTTEYKIVCGEASSGGHYAVCCTAYTHVGEGGQSYTSCIGF